ALPDETYGNAASQLHEGFVLWSCTVYPEVKRLLSVVAAEQQTLPVPCLLLADLLMSVGNEKRALQFLRDAIRRDRPDGAIARIARHEAQQVLKLRRTPGQPNG